MVSLADPVRDPRAHMICPNDEASGGQ
jgi:hypothetical protein